MRLARATKRKYRRSSRSHAPAAGCGTRSGTEKEATQPLPYAWLGVRVGCLRSVGESVEVDEQVRRLELEAVEVGPPDAILVDHVRDDAVHLHAILGRREGMPEGL